MGDSENPYTQQGVRDLQRQAQIALRHATIASTSAKLASAFAAGNLHGDLGELADAIEGLKDIKTGNKETDAELAKLWRRWPKKLRLHVTRLRGAVSAVTDMGSRNGDRTDG